MEEPLDLLFAFSRIAVVPLVGYGIVRFAPHRPMTVLVLLLSLIVVGIAALGYVGHDGFGVDLRSRRMEFGSEIGRWCFAGGGLLLILGVPALPLVAVARARQGSNIGPVGGQWAAVLFGYFMGCLIFSMALYTWMTGIGK